MKARIVRIYCSQLFTLAAALAAAPFFSFRVNACSCATTPICEGAGAITAPVRCIPCKNPPIREALAKADAVFTGNAIEGDVENEEIISDGKKIVLLSGRVIGPDGAPVNKAVVELMSSDKVSIWNDKSATSDSQGRFKLDGLEHGAYLLGINITEEPEKNRPYPPTWYPKAATRQSAAIIELEPGQKLSGYDIMIPRRLAERVIEGTVFWPDGSPAVKADVYLSPSTQPGSGVRKSTYTDSQGRYKFTGYEGIDYYVVASSAPNRDEPPVRNWFFAEPPLVGLKYKNVTGLNLTLTWDEETLEDFFKMKRKR